MHRKRSTIWGPLLTLALVTSPGIALSQSSSDNSSSSKQAGAYNVAPDNSGKNVRDRSSNAITPLNQSNNQSDIDTTRKIRRALMDNKALSTTARNVKIVTVDGTVFLRGPVKSEHEKTVIAHTARQIAGSSHVNDQLKLLAGKQSFSNWSKGNG